MPIEIVWSQLVTQAYQGRHLWHPRFYPEKKLSAFQA